MCVVAVFLAWPLGSASAGPVPGLGGAAETAASTVLAPTQCAGLAKNATEQAAGCVDSNPLLGPIHLPTEGPGRSVDGYIAKMTRRYKRFGSTTQAAFLDLYANVSKDGWKYPPYAGFAIDPETMRPIDHIIMLKPHNHGKPVFVDRFGRETGVFLAPADTSYARRALPPSSLDTFPSPEPLPPSPYNYHLYKVLRPFHVDAGRIAPWFGQNGGGLQYITCVPKDLQEFKVEVDFKCPMGAPDVKGLIPHYLQPEDLPLN